MKEIKMKEFIALRENNNKNYIHPWYISGLTQSDGSFFSVISISKSKNISIRPKFTITTDLDSIYTLSLIQMYFGCGSITVNLKNHSAELVVSKREDIKNKIIPHFDTYPVFCNKGLSFEIFKKITLLLMENSNKHKDRYLKFELVQLSFSMSKDSQRKEERKKEILQILGFNVQDLKIEPVQNKPIINFPPEEFYIGILDGDGSFSVNYLENGKITVNVEITTGINELQLLEHFRAKLEGIGSIHIRKDRVIR